MALAPWRRTRRAPPTHRPESPNRISARHSHLGPEVKRIEDDLPDALTAGGVRVQSGQATYLRRLVMAWQIRSFGYYDILGEIKYSAQFYSRSLANLELYAAEIDDDGEVVRTENAEVIAAVDRIKDPGGTGREGLMSAYGRLMFLVGEALLFVSINPDTGIEQWEMLSNDEIRLTDGEYFRFRAPTVPIMSFRPADDDSYEPVEGEAVAYRLWKKHPRYSALADATMQGVLDLCEQLVLLRQAIRARAVSRLAGSGILFLDDRITTRPNEPVGDEDPEEDPTIVDITEAMTAPLTDEGSASSVVPLIARVKVPDGMKLSDLVYHLQIFDPAAAYPETDLEQKATAQLAIGLDLPAEVLTGMADLNHWGAWQVDESTWKAHLQPIANQLVQDLTAAYLSLYLRDEVGLADWQKYLIAYDESKIVNHPDRSKDAKDLHEMGVIGDAATRQANGFDEDDAPTDEEMDRFIGLKTHDASMAKFGEPGVRTGGVEVAPGEIVTGQGEAAAGQGAPAVQPGPPPKPGSQKNPPEPLAASAAYIGGVAEVALMRAREAAGARLRTAARRSPEALASLEGVKPRDVAAALGRVRVRELLGDQKETDLVCGARDLIVDALAAMSGGGVDEAVAGLIADTIERHAARTIYTAPTAPMPDNFGSYVLGLLAPEARRNGG